MPIQKKTVKLAGRTSSSATSSASSSTATPRTPRTKPARPAAGGADAEPARKNILVAGFEAMNDAHQEALARQRGVFESLLGFGGGRRDAEPPARERDAGLAATAPDPFGFRKFEDVFDQRVARALERLESFAELKAEVEALRARVASLEATGRKR